MRRSSLLLPVLPLAWAACFSSSSGNPGGGANFDASEDTTFPDAPSGEEGGLDVVTTPDSPAEAMPPPQDASVDAPRGDAAETGPVAVAITVFGAGGAEPGITIVYQDATGAVVGTPAMTGPTGAISQPLPTGATMITALLGTAASPAPYTVMGVQPGDAIVVPDFASLAPYAQGIANVTAFPLTPPTMVAEYILTSGTCMNEAPTAPPLTVGLSGSRCVGLGFFGGTYGAALPLLVEADDANGNVRGFAYQKDVSLSGFDAGNEDLDVSLAADTWLTTTTTQTVAVTNPPDGGYLNTVVSESADRILRALGPQYFTDDAGVQQTTVTTHTGYADTLQAEVALTNSPLWSVATATASAPPTANGTVTIDATPLGALAQITATTVDATTTPAQPTMTWTAQGSLASTTTGLAANFYWSGTTDAGVLTNGSWTVVAPSSATSIQIPALPSSASAYAPLAGAQFQTVLQGIAGTAVPTYAQLRTVGTTVASQTVSGCISFPVVPYVPSGTLSITIYSAGQCG